MKSQVLLEEPGRRTFFLVFAPGDAFLQNMVDFVKRHDIKGASFTGLGALSEVTLAWFDTKESIYRPIVVHEQVECASLVGNISYMNGKPFIHAHCVLGRRNGSAIAGHVKDMKALPTLEITLVEHSVGLARNKQPDTGYALIDLP